MYQEESAILLEIVPCFKLHWFHQTYVYSK